MAGDERICNNARSNENSSMKALGDGTERMATRDRGDAETFVMVHESPKHLEPKLFTLSKEARMYSKSDRCLPLAIVQAGLRCVETTDDVETRAPVSSRRSSRKGKRG